ncbi:MAG: porin [Gammaproteobacteria bacterium]|nr:porin [Gemmatimonadota bacterium]NIR98105.1 porin [Gammaproteobacteria bacterium]NIT63798.1 porin [Gammaproteobacteria bacterium]NIV20753.1 porin [Gammaproteobacteria bacterium]NIY32378.1 porin [Gammaproteobacteria bacterium]
MQKKLIHLAVGAALAAGPFMAANADLKVFGHFQIEASSEDNDPDAGFVGTDGAVVQALNRGESGDPGCSAGTSCITLEDNQRGRFGFHATEDLGNGLTALAHYETQVDTATANLTEGNRESYVGLKGNFGTFQAGSLKSAYKYTGGVKYDPFVTTNLEARRYGGMVTGRFGQNSFMRNSLAYISPSFNGLKLWLTYSPDEGGTGNGAGTDDGDYSLAVKFGQGPFEVFFASTGDDGGDERTGIPDGPDFSLNKIGGKFSMGPHTILGQWEDGTLDGIGGLPDTDLNVLFLGYHFKFGQNLFVAQFGDGQVENDLAAVDQEDTYWAIGAIHKFSKKTRIFGGYRSTDVENGALVSGSDGEGSAFTVGMRVDF